MIYSVTLNPAVDRQLTVPSIEFDKVLRASNSRIDPGGKGFNVSRMIRQLGGKSVALGLLGGNSGRLLSESLEADGIATDFVWVQGETRTNVSVVTSSEDHYLKVNELGPIVSSDELEAFREKLLGRIEPNDWCVLCGSLPLGAPDSFYASLIEQLNEAGVRTVLDTSGEALKNGCAAKPFLVTPNLEEATEIAGQSRLQAVALEICSLGAERVVVTLGSDGAAVHTEAGLIRARPPAIHERNAIGAGDALVGGLVYGLSNGFSLSEALCWGVACGTVAASLEGTTFGDRMMIEQMLTCLQTGNPTEKS